MGGVRACVATVSSRRRWGRGRSSELVRCEREAMGRQAWADMHWSAQGRSQGHAPCPAPCPHAPPCNGWHPDGGDSYGLPAAGGVVRGGGGAAPVSSGQPGRARVRPCWTDRQADRQSDCWELYWVRAGQGVETGQLGWMGGWDGLEAGLGRHVNMFEPVRLSCRVASAMSPLQPPLFLSASVASRPRKNGTCGPTWG